MQKDKVEVNDLSNDEWMLILLMLVLEDERQKDDTWNDFAKGLIYENRFSSDSPIVTEIRKRAEWRAKLLLLSASDRGSKQSL